MNDIPALIKGIAKAAIEQEKPVAVVTGRIIDNVNFKIETEQKMILNKDFIIFPQRYANKSWKENDSVILLRCDGGQKYLLMDLI